jgi:hypothetical protein
MHHRHVPPLVISCDECAMQSTSTCDDCVVTFLLRGSSDDRPDVATAEPITLDLGEERAVRLLARAGLIPQLRYRVAS